nr:lysophospholipid acyltransferase family protein [Brevundimonas diminuta]
MTDQLQTAPEEMQAQERDGLLIVVRSLIFNFAFYAWSLLIALLIVPTLVGPPGTIIWWCKRWHGGTRVLLKFICGIEVVVRGEQFKPRNAALVAAKHQCAFDAFAPLFDLPCPTIVGKQELASIPLFAQYAARARLILSIDRSGHAKALRHMISEGRRALADGRQLVIFPEGTRTPPGARPDYKPGVAGLYSQLGAECYPVATNAGVHWVSGSFIRRPGTIVFEYLPPIKVGLPRAEFMRELEGRIETASLALLRFPVIPD